MKLLLILLIVLMSGCINADITQHELKKAKEQCSKKGGIYKIRVYTNGVKPLAYCKDGTKWRG